VKYGEWAHGHSCNRIVLYFIPSSNSDMGQLFCLTFFVTPYCFRQIPVTTIPQLQPPAPLQLYNLLSYKYSWQRWHSITKQKKKSFDWTWFLKRISDSPKNNLFNKLNMLHIHALKEYLNLYFNINSFLIKLFSFSWLGSSDPFSLH